MRNRTTILLLLACVFATLPVMESMRHADLCAERYGESSDDTLSFVFASDGSCPIEKSSTPLERLMLVLAVGCAGAGLISAGKGLRDRQRDQALLQRASFAMARVSLRH